MCEMQNENIKSQFSESVMPHLMQRMIDFYSDKPQGFIRELTANAQASVLKNGSGEIRITTPTDILPYFVIEDTGVGMSPQDVQDYYVNYGTTSYPESALKFGIGSLAPLAFVDEYEVETVKDGVKTSFSMLKNNGVPGSTLHPRVEETEQCNGTKITAMVTPSLFGRCLATLQNVGDFMLDVPVYIDGKLAPRNTREVADTLVSEIVINKEIGATAKLYVDLFDVKLFEDLENLDKETIAEIPMVCFGQSYYGGNGSRRHPSQIRVEISANAVDFNAQREEIIQNEKTANIRRKLRTAIGKLDFPKLAIGAIVSHFEELRETSNNVAAFSLAGELIWLLANSDADVSSLDAVLFKEEFSFSDAVSIIRKNGYHKVNLVKGSTVRRKIGSTLHKSTVKVNAVDFTPWELTMWNGTTFLTDGLTDTEILRIRNSLKILVDYFDTPDFTLQLIKTDGSDAENSKVQKFFEMFETKTGLEKVDDGRYRSARELLQALDLLAPKAKTQKPQAKQSTTFRQIRLIERENYLSGVAGEFVVIDGTTPAETVFIANEDLVLSLQILGVITTQSNVIAMDIKQLTLKDVANLQNLDAKCYRSGYLPVPEGKPQKTTAFIEAMEPVKHNSSEHFMKIHGFGKLAAAWLLTRVQDVVTQYKGGFGEIEMHCKELYSRHFSDVQKLALIEGKHRTEAWLNTLKGKLDAVGYERESKLNIQNAQAIYPVVDPSEEYEQKLAALMMAIGGGEDEVIEFIDSKIEELRVMS